MKFRYLHAAWGLLSITVWAALPPPTAIDACARRAIAIDNPCSFNDIQGTLISGTCQIREEVLACWPDAEVPDPLPQPALTPDQTACENRIPDDTCEFEGVDGLQQGTCQTRADGVNICMTSTAPRFLPPPEEDGEMPPPPLLPGTLLSPPPILNAPLSTSGVLAPPPQHLPGTMTRTEDLRQRASLFNLNWQAQQTNVTDFLARSPAPQHRPLPRGEHTMMRVDNDEPIYYGTDTPSSSTTLITPQSTAANSSALWSVGITSTDTTCLGEWDVGAVFIDHQEFSTRVTQGDTPSSNSDHSTHVAGTMIAAGVDENAQGIAYEACLHSYDWDDADSEMAQAAADGLLVSNHSYGVMSGWVHIDTNANGQEQWCWYGQPHLSTVEDYKFGFYNSEAETLDQIAKDAPYYLIVKAAGNDRNNNPADSDVVDVDFDYSCDNFVAYSSEKPGGDGVNNNGYDTLMPGSTAKNILTVGAADETQSVSSFSAWGPTDDGRIKPDLVAFGVGVYSTSSAGSTNYDLKNGTSMASPSVASSLGLIQQYYKQLNTDRLLRAASLKALALHTATDLGHTGPDYQTGWGHLNNIGMTAVLSAQATAFGEPFLHVYELSLGEDNPESLDLNIPADTEELRVTLVWNDAAGSPPALSLDPSDVMLVNDLDLRLIASDDSEYQPWVLDPTQPEVAATTGDNTLDNVEQIRLSVPNSGHRAYRVQVSHKDQLSEDYQAFSLIISGNSALSDAEFDLRQNDIVLNDSHTFSFGQLAEGSSLEKIFTLYNRGGSDLNISALNLSGDGFTLSQALGSDTLSAGASTTFAITVTGGIDTELTGLLSLTNDDADESAFSLNLAASVEASGTVNGFDDALAVDGICSLREAIINANADTQIHADCPVTQDISLPSGTYTLSVTGSDEDASQTGDLDITRSLVIRGTGMSKTIIQAGDSVGNGIDRLLQVPESSGVNLTLQGLTLQHGNAADSYGGGLHFDSSDGTLSLDQVSISDNSALRGGGIYVKTGHADITWSLISNNTATTSSGNGGGGINCTFNGSLSLLNSAVLNNDSGQFGGAIIAETATLENATISGNSALAGGGIVDMSSQAGTINLEHVTLYNNTSLVANYAAGIMLYKSHATFHNSIIAGNTSNGAALNTGHWNNGDGSLTSQGYNLSNSHDWTAAVSDLLDQDLSSDIAVQALANNGGTTPNHLLALNSVAIDAAQTCASDYDQRGQARMVGTSCDIGAIEVQTDDHPTDNVGDGSDTSTDGTPQNTATQQAQRVMDWGESLLPDIFPASTQQSLSFAPYEARFYPDINSYLGYNTEDGYFYAYNLALWGTDILKLGSLEEYLTMAEEAGF